MGTDPANVNRRMLKALMFHLGVLMMCATKEETKPRLERLIETMDRLASAIYSLDEKLGVPRPPPLEPVLTDAELVNQFNTQL